MSLRSRRALRERFDDANHPAPQRMPHTHHRDRYLATDGSMTPSGARIGAVLEAASGRTIGRWHGTVPAPDNNAAEVAALHFGLDLAACHLSRETSLGVLLDHDVLARAVAACATPGLPTPVRPPCGSASPNHWGGITARVAALTDVRVGLVDSRENPAHPVANRGLA